MFWHRPWHRRYRRRRRFWRPRPFFCGPGCGCLPLIMVLGLVMFMCLMSMCSGSWYYGY